MPEDAVAIRLRALEGRADKVEDHKASRRDLDGLAEDVRELKEEVKSLRRAIVAFSFTVAASAVVFAFVQLAGTP